MSSLYSNVNKRSHKTLSDKAKCTQCKVTYNTFKVLNDENVCFHCLGHTLESWTALKVAEFQTRQEA